MARSSIRPTGPSLTRLALRGLAVALGTVGLVLLGWTAASAALPDEPTDAAASSVTGLVDDLTGSTLAPLTDVLAPLTDPVDAAAAPVVEPVRETLEPLTRPVGDAVRDVARPAAAPPADGVGPTEPERHHAEAAGSPSDAGATQAGGRDADWSGTIAADDAPVPDTTILAGERVAAPVMAPDILTSDAGSGTSADQRSVQVDDLDFGPGSALLAAWALAEHGAVTAAGFVGPLPLGTHVGADDTLVAVLGSADHDRTSQNSTRPDVSPG